MIKFSTVKKGSSGTSVVVLQSLFRAMQYLGKDGKVIEIDGRCGDNTVFAINTFQSVQRAYGFECGTAGKNDGSFGSACWERLLGVSTDA